MKKVFGVMAVIVVAMQLSNVANANDMSQPFSLEHILSIPVPKTVETSIESKYAHPNEFSQSKPVEVKAVEVKNNITNVEPTQSVSNNEVKNLNTNVEQPAVSKMTNSDVSKVDSEIVEEKAAKIDVTEQAKAPETVEPVATKQDAEPKTVDSNAETTVQKTAEQQVENTVEQPVANKQADVTAEKTVENKPEPKKLPTVKYDWTSVSSVEKVNILGQNLLQKSKIPTEVSFNVMVTDELNAFANLDKEVFVYTGLLNYITDVDELAAVISHEIGHIVNNHTAKKAVLSYATNQALANVKMGRDLKPGVEIARDLTMLKMSRTDEYEADVTGVDLLVAAGHNPLAMVSLLYKISGVYQDFLSTHPSGDKRTMYTYDYIAYAYPEYLNQTYDTVAFQNFLTYAQPIIEARNSNPKELAKFNAEQKKLKEKRDKKIMKYKSASQNSGWDNAVKTINTFETGKSLWNQYKNGGLKK